MANDASTNSFAGELHIEVFGTELSGRQFIEQTRILTIARDGATISLANKLAPDSELIVRNPANNKEAIARVVDLIREEMFVHVYAIAFVDTPVNPWQAEFPEAMPPATVTLECSRCHAVDAVSLSEIEKDVFESKQTLTRHCDCSKSSTTWKPTDRRVGERRAPEQRTSDRRQESPRVEKLPARRSHEKRREKRTPMSPPACIRSQGWETVVECEDVSRGGFRFKSRRAFPEGARIEVAVPYAKSSNDIFVAARIAYAQPLSGGFFRYGVAYVKAAQKHDSKY
jgi:hypothetical protein